MGSTAAAGLKSLLLNYRAFQAMRCISSAAHPLSAGDCFGQRSIPSEKERHQNIKRFAVISITQRIVLSKSGIPNVSLPCSSNRN